MDTVYGNKKYFQTLATTDNDYYNRHSSSANRVMVSQIFLLFVSVLFHLLVIVRAIAVVCGLL